MKNFLLKITLLSAVCAGCIVASCAAETVVLKSGKKIDAVVVERNDDYVSLKVNDARLYYYWNSIASINGMSVQEDVPVEKTLEELREENVLLKEALKEMKSIYHNNLGGAYTYAQLFDKAGEQYEQAIELDPANSQAYYNLGLIYEHHFRDYARACAEYRVYLEISPDDQQAVRLRRFCAESCPVS